MHVLSLSGINSNIIKVIQKNFLLILPMTYSNQSIVYYMLIQPISVLFIFLFTSNINKIEIVIFSVFILHQPESTKNVHISKGFWWLSQNFHTILNYLVLWIWLFFNSIKNITLLVLSKNFFLPHRGLFLFEDIYFILTAAV